MESEDNSNINSEQRVLQLHFLFVHYFILLKDVFRMRTKIISVIALIFCGFAITFALISDYVSPVTVVMSIVMLCIIIGGLIYRKKMISFKYSTVANVLKEHNPDLIYIPEPRDTKEHISVIKKNRLISNASTFKFTDCIEDKVLDYTYRSYNLHATHVQSTGKSSSTVTDFKGKFYAVSVGEEISNYILKEERFKSVPSPYEFYELESIDFNKHLNLYCTDKVQIHSVFTPAVIKDYSELVLSDYYKTYVAYIDKVFYLFFYDSEQDFNSLSMSKEDIILEYEAQKKNLQNYLEIFFKKY